MCMSAHMKLCIYNEKNRAELHGGTADTRRQVLLLFLVSVFFIGNNLRHMIIITCSPAAIHLQSII